MPAQALALPVSTFFQRDVQRARGRIAPPGGVLACDCTYRLVQEGVLRRAILTCYPTVPLRLTPDYSTVAHRVLLEGKVPAFATSYGITLIL